MFAHRTAAGGPMRRANSLKPGDVVMAGGTKYKVRRLEIISSNQVKRALSFGGGPKRLSLITCTRPDGTPTSTKWRLIVRAST
jgi:sortase (surface protein transpeptidase)